MKIPPDALERRGNGRQAAGNVFDDLGDERAMGSGGFLVRHDAHAGVRQMLREYIELEGHRVIEAPNSTSARQALAQESVDLIFLDVMMPGMDGWQVLEKLKQNPDTKHIPVVIFTAREYSNGKALGLKKNLKGVWKNIKRVHPAKEYFCVCRW